MTLAKVTHLLVSSDLVSDNSIILGQGHDLFQERQALIKADLDGTVGVGIQYGVQHTDLV